MRAEELIEILKHIVKSKNKNPDVFMNISGVLRGVTEVEFDKEDDIILRTKRN